MPATDQVFGVTTGQFTIPVGVTVATLIDAGSVPGCQSVYLEYFSGGTLQLLGVNNGATLTAAQLVAAGVTLSGYVMPTGRGVSIDGPARFYLAATGATTIVNFIFGRSMGY